MVISSIPLNVKHVKLKRLLICTGFITILLGDIMTMPGLSKKPNCELIDVVDGEIVNLS